jgi:hypothetical protein
LFRRAACIAVQDGSTALLIATYPERRELALPMVKWLVAEAGSDVKSERDDVREGLLAQRGADVVVVVVGTAAACIKNVVSAAAVFQSGQTALLRACCAGTVELVEWLVTQASCDARSERDNVRAMWSAFAVALVTHASWLAMQDGCSALLLACKHGRVDVAQWLVANAGSDAASERDKVCSLSDTSTQFMSACDACFEAWCVCGIAYRMVALPCCWQALVAAWRC